MMYGPKKINQALIDMKIQACERSWPQPIFLLLFLIFFNNKFKHRDSTYYISS